MGWLTGKPKAKREPVTCNVCQGDKTLPVLGLKPGGTWTKVDTKPCPNCNGRGEV